MLILIHWPGPRGAILSSSRKGNKGFWVNFYFIKLIMEILHGAPALNLPRRTKWSYHSAVSRNDITRWRDTGYLMLVARSGWQLHVNILIKTNGPLHNKCLFKNFILFHGGKLVTGSLLDERVGSCSAESYRQFRVVLWAEAVQDWQGGSENAGGLLGLWCL